MKIRGRAFLCLLFAGNLYAATDTPPELMEALRLAAINHPDMAKAKSDVFAAKAVVEGGGYRWYPRLEVNSQLGSSQVGGAGNRSLNFSIKQPLWDAGRVDSDFAISKASESVSINSMRETLDTLGMRTSTAYFNVLRTREQQKVAKQNVEDHFAMFRSVSNRREGGLGSKSDVALATSRLQQAKASEAQWRGEVDKASATYFSVVAERPPAQMGEVNINEKSMEFELVIDMVKSRSPLLQKLRYEVLREEAGLESKKAQLYPTLYARIDHLSYLGGATNSFYQDDTRFTVNFEWQNDVAISQRFQIQAAEQRVMSARYAVESAERQLVEVVNGYWQDYIVSKQRMDELGKYQVSALDTLAIFRKQFNLGKRSWPEVMNSLQDLFNARSQYVDAKYQSMIAWMRIAFLIGEMDEYALSPELDTFKDNLSSLPVIGPANAAVSHDETVKINHVSGLVKKLSNWVFD